jgi:hypothetical protein
MERMKDQPRDPFVKIDVFDGIRQERAPLRRAAIANVEAGAEEKESVNQPLAALGRGIAELNGGRETEVVEAHSEGLGPVEEFRIMKMAIERIEGSVQREIRKIQRNARKAERDREDIEERWVSRMAIERRENQSTAAVLLVFFVLMFSVVLFFFGTDAVTSSFAKEFVSIGFHFSLIGCNRCSEG